MRVFNVALRYFSRENLPRSAVIGGGGGGVGSIFGFRLESLSLYFWLLSVLKLEYKKVTEDSQDVGYETKV